MKALPTGSVLAIDPGSKHTGFAISDPLRLIIEPLDTWHGPGESKALLDAIDALTAERTIGVILMGLLRHEKHLAAGDVAPTTIRYQKTNLADDPFSQIRL